MKIPLLVHRFRAHDIRRHQIGRELDAVERQIQRVGNGLNQQGFGQAGHAHQQAVALRKHSGKHQPHYLVLPHDDLADFLAQLLEGGGQGIGSFFIVLKLSHSEVQEEGKKVIRSSLYFKRRMFRITVEIAPGYFSATSSTLHWAYSGSTSRYTVPRFLANHSSKAFVFFSLRAAAAIFW